MVCFNIGCIKSEWIDQKSNNDSLMVKQSDSKRKATADGPTN
jgi:hypothetical protein